MRHYNPPLLCLALILPVLALSQTTAPPARFDSVFVQASPAGVRQGAGQMQSGAASYVDTSMLTLIAAAYGVTADKVSGGPDWLPNRLYNLRARGPATATPDQMQQMLQAVLIERFGLKTHTESKPLPTYVLTTGKGAPKLKAAASAGPAGACKIQRPNAAEISARTGLTYNCIGISMAEFADALSHLAPAYVNQPVSDHTGLNGRYDFQLRFMARGGLHPVSDPDYDPAVDVSFFGAVEALGLKLDLVPTPTPVLVVDAVNPDVLIDAAHPMTAPPVPTTFDVAAIKSITNVTRQDRIYRVTPGGEVDICCDTLQALIVNAFNLGPDRIANAPKWLNDDNWNIQAKTAPGATMFDLDPMLQDLLKTRFGLVMHDDKIPMPVYSLHATGDHAKLTPNTAGGRSACVVSPGDGVNNRRYTCTNMTMAEFADKLPGYAPNFIDRRVVDLSGLAGAWDFTFAFAPLNAATLRPNADAGGPPVSPGALTIFDAVAQLGLKLVPDKQPVPVNFIDHIDRTPTAN